MNVREQEIPAEIPKAAIAISATGDFVEVYLTLNAITSSMDVSARQQKTHAALNSRVPTVDVAGSLTYKTD